MNQFFLVSDVVIKRVEKHRNLQIEIQLLKRQQLKRFKDSFS